MVTGARSGIVVAHDYLTQRGGAERVALHLAQGLRADRIVTSLYDADRTFAGFGDFPVAESDWPLLRPFRTDPRRALPLLAHAWSRMPAVDADVLVCSSSGWAHGLAAGAYTLKVVYCHNPARWLYQPEDYTREHGRTVRTALRALSPALRRWDRRASGSADVYVANSTSVATRIRRAYGIEARVVHPPMTLDVAGAQSAPPALDDGFFLSVGRARGYKGTDRLIDAFAAVPGERLVLVGVDPDPTHPANVQALGRVSEHELRWLYAHARALISVSHEDFGLTPIEANAFGTPSLVLRAGGFLDSTAEGVSGLFIPTDTVADILTAVRTYPSRWDRGAIRAHADRFAPAVFLRQLQDVIDDARGTGHTAAPAVSSRHPGPSGQSDG